jgi:hypothetical protein
MDPMDAAPRLEMEDDPGEAHAWLPVGIMPDEADWWLESGTACSVSVELLHALGFAGNTQLATTWADAGHDTAEAAECVRAGWPA